VIIPGRLVVLSALAILPLVAWAQGSLLGSYKMVSLQVTVDGQPAPATQAPHGYLIITPKLYFHGFTAAARKFGTSIEERAALWDTLNFFGGPYQVDGDKLTISVTTSFNETWTGQQQLRTFKIEGSRLTLVSPPMPNPRDRTKTLVATQVWERIE
jgi:hypothetical protein